VAARLPRLQGCTRAWPSLGGELGRERREHDPCRGLTLATGMLKHGHCWARAWTLPEVEERLKEREGRDLRLQERGDAFLRSALATTQNEYSICIFFCWRRFFHPKNTVDDPL